MATLIDPACATPLFQMDSANTARECGKISGYMSAIVVSIIVIGVMMYFFVKSGREYQDEEGVMRTKPKSWWILAVGFVVLIGVWIIVPTTSAWLNVRRFEGFQEQLKSLMAQGFSKTQAMSKMQDLVQTKMTANATVLAGEEIASAFAMRK